MLGSEYYSEPGRTSTSKSYMWLYRTSGCAEYPIVLYEYQRWSTPRHFSRISPAGCTRTATRATTSCGRISWWWAAGLMPGESLTMRCRRCPKRNGRILWRHGQKDCPQVRSGQDTALSKGAGALSGALFGGGQGLELSNTLAGAQSSSVIYRLIETAKENDLDPYRYLVWLLHNAPGLSRTDEAFHRGVSLVFLCCLRQNPKTQQGAIEGSYCLCYTKLQGKNNQIQEEGLLNV